MGVWLTVALPVSVLGLIAALDVAPALDAPTWARIAIGVGIGVGIAGAAIVLAYTGLASRRESRDVLMRAVVAGVIKHPLAEELERQKLVEVEEKKRKRERAEERDLADELEETERQRRTVVEEGRRPVDD